MELNLLLINYTISYIKVKQLKKIINLEIIFLSKNIINLFLLKNIIL